MPNIKIEGICVLPRVSSEEPCSHERKNVRIIHLDNEESSTVDSEDERFEFPLVLPNLPDLWDRRWNRWRYWTHERRKQQRLRNDQVKLGLEKEFVRNINSHVKCQKRISSAASSPVLCNCPHKQPCKKKSSSSSSRCKYEINIPVIHMCNCGKHKTSTVPPLKRNLSVKEGQCIERMSKSETSMTTILDVEAPTNLCSNVRHTTSQIEEKIPEMKDIGLQSTPPEDMTLHSISAFEEPNKGSFEKQQEENYSTSTFIVKPRPTQEISKRSTDPAVSSKPKIIFTDLVESRKPKIISTDPVASRKPKVTSTDPVASSKSKIISTNKINLKKSTLKKLQSYFNTPCNSIQTIKSTLSLKSVRSQGGNGTDNTGEEKVLKDISGHLEYQRSVERQVPDQYEIINRPVSQESFISHHYVPSSKSIEAEVNRLSKHVLKPKGNSDIRKGSTHHYSDKFSSKLDCNIDSSKPLYFSPVILSSNNKKSKKPSSVEVKRGRKGSTSKNESHSKRSSKMCCTGKAEDDDDEHNTRGRPGTSKAFSEGSMQEKDSWFEGSTIDVSVGPESVSGELTKRSVSTSISSTRFEQSFGLKEPKKDKENETNSLEDEKFSDSALNLDRLEEKETEKYLTVSDFKEFLNYLEERLNQLAPSPRFDVQTRDDEDENKSIHIKPVIRMTVSDIEQNDIEVKMEVEKDEPNSNILVQVSSPTLIVTPRDNSNKFESTRSRQEEEIHNSESGSENGEKEDVVDEIKLKKLEEDLRQVQFEIEEDEVQEIEDDGKKESYGIFTRKDSTSDESEIAPVLQSLSDKSVEMKEEEMEEEEEEEEKKEVMEEEEEKEEEVMEVEEKEEEKREENKLDEKYSDNISTRGLRSEDEIILPDIYHTLYKPCLCHDDVKDDAETFKINKEQEMRKQDGKREKISPKTHLKKEESLVKKSSSRDDGGGEEIKKKRKKKRSPSKSGLRKVSNVSSQGRSLSFIKTGQEITCPYCAQHCNSLSQPQTIAKDRKKKVKSEGTQTEYITSSISLLDAKMKPSSIREEESRVDVNEADVDEMSYLSHNKQPQKEESDFSISDNASRSSENNVHELPKKLTARKGCCCVKKSDQNNTESKKKAGRHQRCFEEVSSNARSRTNQTSISKLNYGPRERETSWTRRSSLSPKRDSSQYSRRRSNSSTAWQSVYMKDYSYQQSKRASLQRKRNASSSVDKGEVKPAIPNVQVYVPSGCHTHRTCSSSYSKTTNVQSPPCLIPQQYQTVGSNTQQGHSAACSCNPNEYQWICFDLQPEEQTSGIQNYSTGYTYHQGQQNQSGCEGTSKRNICNNSSINFCFVPGYNQLFTKNKDKKDGSLTLGLAPSQATCQTAKADNVSKVGCYTLEYTPVSLSNPSSNAEFTKKSEKPIQKIKDAVRGVTNSIRRTSTRLEVERRSTLEKQSISSGSLPSLMRLKTHLTSFPNKKS